MIHAIADGWGRGATPAWADAQGRSRDRRRNRPAVVTRENVSIDPDSAELAAFDAIGWYEDRAADDFDVSIAELAMRLSALPTEALAAQARIGESVVRRLITVNAVNRV